MCKALHVSMMQTVSSVVCLLHPCKHLHTVVLTASGQACHSHRMLLSFERLCLACLDSCQVTLLLHAVWRRDSEKVQAEPGRLGWLGASEQDQHRWHHPERGQVHQPLLTLPGASHHCPSGRSLHYFLQPETYGLLDLRYGQTVPA